MGWLILLIPTNKRNVYWPGFESHHCPYLFINNKCFQDERFITFFLILDGFMAFVGIFMARLKFFTFQVVVNAHKIWCNLSKGCWNCVMVSFSWDIIIGICQKFGEKACQYGKWDFNIHARNIRQHDWFDKSLFG